MTTWILERNVFSEECFDRMIKHFNDNDISYHAVTVLPFIHTIEGKTPKVESSVIVYGSIGLQKLAIQNNWKPGVWTTDNFNEIKVKNALGDLYLNSDSQVLNISEVSDKIDMEEFFIKPNTDTKEFAGTLMKKSEFNSWYNRMIDIGYLENNDFEVVVSKPKEFGTEYRLVVASGYIIGASQYKKYNIGKTKRIPLIEFQPFVNILEQKYKPIGVYVVDITNTENGYKVIEYNTFNSAGLYDIEVGHVIDQLNLLYE